MMVPPALLLHMVRASWHEFRTERDLWASRFSVT
jgi:hypothetical protein